MLELASAQAGPPSGSGYVRNSNGKPRALARVTGPGPIVRGASCPGLPQLSAQLAP